MRKLLLSLLLAGVAASPAFADPDRSDHHWQDRADRQAERAERQQARSERAAPAERPHFGGGNFTGNSNGGQQNFARSERFQQNVQQPDPAQVEAFRDGRQRDRGGDGDRRDGRRNWQGRNGFQGQPTVSDESLRQQDRPLPNVLRRHDRSPVASDIPRQGTQPPRFDNRRREQVSWNRDWRHDGRYDWRRWRDQHRSRFHIGIYYDPFGWGYQPFSIGYRLWPNYYSSSYWISDPWEYRLPYAPPGTRWVRYYNDAVLVDTFTGEVVDVIQNFFW